MDDKGYVRVSRHIKEHRLVCEKAIGKPLPTGSVVHHHGGNKSKNSSGLVLCQDDSYHRLLHQREKALRSCGNANWKICGYCHQYDDPNNLVLSKSGNHINYRHKACFLIYNRKRRGRKSKGGEH